MKRRLRLVLLLAMTACAARQTQPRDDPSAQVLPLPTVRTPEPIVAAPKEQRTVRPREPRFTYSPHPDRDAVVQQELTKVDAELKAKFDFETGHQHYGGAAEDLFGRIDQRTGQYLSIGAWRGASNERDAFAERLSALINQQPSPQYTATALVREGSLDDSMWQGMTTLEQRGFSLFSPKQLATLSSMCPTPSSPSCSFAQDIRAAVQRSFQKKRAAETEASAERAIGCYAWAIAFSKQFAVTDPAIERARNRLAAFRGSLGDQEFSLVLQTARPPQAIADRDERVNFESLGLP